MNNAFTHHFESAILNDKRLLRRFMRIKLLIISEHRSFTKEHYYNYYSSNEAENLTLTASHRKHY